MKDNLLLTLFDNQMSDDFAEGKVVNDQTAEKIFVMLARVSIFKWGTTHNYCECRAEASSLLLNAAGIPHAKAWVFGASFLRKHYIGGLKNLWNYHVAIALPVDTVEGLLWFVIDPSVASGPVLLCDWAASVTDYSHSYHILKESQYYIFPEGNIVKDKWHKRNRQNFKWTIQGLAGVNGLTNTGKAQLVFKKNKIYTVRKEFDKLLKAMSENTQQILGSCSPVR